MLLDLRSLIFATTIGLQLVGQAPTVQQNVGTELIADTGITPDVGAIALTGQASLLDSGLIPSFGQLTGTGQVSVVGNGVIPDQGSLALTGAAPELGGSVFITDPSGNLTLTTFSPTVREGNPGVVVRRRHFAKGWTRT